MQTSNARLLVTKRDYKTVFSIGEPPSSDSHSKNQNTTAILIDGSKSKGNKLKMYINAGERSLYATENSV